MPNGILNIMKLPIKKFHAEEALNQLIESYFATITDQTNITQPTITGLALYLGFNSREEFEAYINKGKFAHLIKRACLQIEAIYEKKLIQPSPSGAIFALKSLGWNEKPEEKTNDGKSKTLKVKIIESGPKPADNEKEVTL
jgi:hypothetical protein